MAPPAPREHYRFGNFDLDVAGYRLSRNGRPVRIERQPMDLLILLVANRQRLVTRAEIVDSLWGKDVFVDVETGVHTAIRKIRLALRDSPENPAFVETVAGKGYRFVAPVEEVAAEPPLVVERETRPSAVTASRPWRQRTAIGFIAFVSVVGLASWAWRGLQQRADATVTVAVLPFENLSGDPGREYLADGLAEETIVSLGQIDPERVHVVGRTSMMIYKRTTKSLATIGRELHADYLVESAVHAEGGQLRITAKLIRVHDQVQMWSRAYDRAPGRILAMQQELAGAIAEEVRLRLSSDRLDAIARRQSRNAEAYDLYLRGRNFANQRTPLTTTRAIEYFQRATALDPDYALAWSGLAFAYLNSPVNGDADPLEVRPRTVAAVAQAIRADPNLVDAQLARAQTSFFFEWDWPSAETAARRAIALDSRNAMAHQVLGNLLSHMGRHAEAQPEMRRARELDPLFAMRYAISSQVAFHAGENALAVEYARHAISIDPDFWIGHFMLAQAHAQLGQTDLALDALTPAVRLSGSNSKPLSLRGYVLAKDGRVVEARALLATLETVSRQRYVPPYTFALIYAGLGEREAALEWLERAYSARDVHLVFLPVDAKWNAYRDDPRFVSFLARCDFMRTLRPAAPTQ